MLTGEDLGLAWAVSSPPSCGRGSGWSPGAWRQARGAPLAGGERCKVSREAAQDGDLPLAW